LIFELVYLTNGPLNGAGLARPRLARLTKAGERSRTPLEVQRFGDFSPRGSSSSCSDALEGKEW